MVHNLRVKIANEKVPVCLRSMSDRKNPRCEVTVREPQNLTTSRLHNLCVLGFELWQNRWDFSFWLLLLHSKLWY